MTELYKKYRPIKLEDIVGQADAVRQLKKWIKKKDIPHALLFSGPSGVGKTTLARIIRRRLGCSKADFQELNIADVRGIDEVRSIQSRISLAPLGGTSRIWLLDECHRMVNLAQDCLLKMLEDTPSHVYFMLATTDPTKLLETIRTRCTPLKLNHLDLVELKTVLVRVLKAENKSISEEVSEKICEQANGSPRKALVLLNAVIDLDSEEEQLEAVEAGAESKEAIHLCRLLINERVTWKEVAKVLKEITSEPEMIRKIILAYVATVALNGGKLNRCQLIMEAFSDTLWDTMKVGLVRPCLEVVNSTSR